MRREAQAEEMRAAGLAKKPADATPEPDQLVAAFKPYLAKRVGARSVEGQALRRMLEEIEQTGLTPRLLQALEMTRYMQVTHEMRCGRIGPAKGHIQLSKIMAELRKLLAIDTAPDETVPANVSVMIGREHVCDDDDQGDPIDVANARGEAL